MPALECFGEELWEVMDFAEPPHGTTLVNLTNYDFRHENITSVDGDARRMTQFALNEFDMAFSNSVIEHAGSFEDQSKMAREIKRVARSYFVQTPNFFFPIGPHVVLPFFHWFPVSVRVWLVRNFSPGFIKKTPDFGEARRIVNETRLLTYSELKQLFPDGAIVRERFLGLTKSFIVLKNSLQMQA